jgi:hypothetical protein
MHIWETGKIKCVTINGCNYCKVKRNYVDENKTTGRIKNIVVKHREDAKKLQKDNATERQLDGGKGMICLGS